MASSDMKVLTQAKPKVVEYWLPEAVKLARDLLAQQLPLSKLRKAVERARTAKVNADGRAYTMSGATCNVLCRVAKVQLQQEEAAMQRAREQANARLRNEHRDARAEEVRHCADLISAYRRTGRREDLPYADQPSRGLAGGQDVE